MANLFPFPYADSTKTANGITYTVNSDKSINVSGAATADSQFYVVEASDPIELGPGYYTLQGTGDSDIQIALISVYTPGGTILYIPAGENDANFTLTETKQFHAQIGVPSGTTADLTVAPGLVKTGDVVNIDTENAKQIRKSMDVRIQVTPAQGDPIVITNENLISCVVSLRSDLSILEPTLPESEINIEAYMDEDISDILASIPGETPVTYQAGYPGDMSPVRHFYLAEQITWADNVMSIHAVDAVHKLDVRADPVLIGMQPDGAAAGVQPSSIDQLYGLITYYLDDKLGILDQMDIEDSSSLETGLWSRLHSQSAVYEGTVRDFVNAAMWLFRCVLLESNTYTREIWITYVDAGIPKLRHTKPTSKWDVYESDCGDVQRFTGRKINSITVPIKDLYIAIDTSEGTGIEGGSAEWIYNQGVFFTFDKPMLDYIMRFNGTAFAPTTQYGADHSIADDWWSPTIFVHDTYGNRIGQFLLTSDLPNGVLSGEVYYPDYDDPVNTVVFSSYVPWNSFVRSEWIRTWGSAGWNQDSRQVGLFGEVLSEQLSTYVLGTSGGDGEDVVFSDPLWTGNLRNYASVPGTTATRNIIVYPNKAIEAMKNRSNITGSFVWKGDPRMQPRDVVTFHRLDGTTEDITLENITITHEKGGTSAEITYRKGIC